MCRSETLGLTSQRRLFSDDLCSIWRPTDLSDEHGEALTVSYLASILGDRDCAESLVNMLRHNEQLISSPLFLFLLGKYVADQQQINDETMRSLLASPGRLYRWFAGFFLREREARDHNLTDDERATISSITRRVALAMLDQRTFVIDRAGLENIVECRYELFSSSLEPLLGQMRFESLGLSERQLLSERPAAITDLVCRHGFLRRTGDTYSFKHDSLRDFFVGSLLAERKLERPRHRLMEPPAPGRRDFHEALSLLDSATAFALDLLPANEAIRLAESLLGERISGTPRGGSERWGPHSKLIARILSSNSDLSRELAISLARRLVCAFRDYFRYGKQSGADLDLLFPLPSYVLDLLIDVQPEFADDLGNRLERMAAGNFGRTVDVAHRVADACERRNDQIRAFELRRRVVELGEEGHSTVNWVLDILSSPGLAARAAYPDADGSEQLAALVRTLLRDRARGVLCRVLEGLMLEGLNKRAPDVAGRLISAGAVELAGAWQCALIEHNVLPPDSANTEVYCAALASTAWSRTALRLLKHPEFMEQIRALDDIPEVVRALVACETRDKDALGFLIDVCLRREAGDSEEEAFHYLRSRVLAGEPAAITHLAVPDRVHLLFDLFAAEGRVKSVAAALRGLNVAARRDLFQELVAHTEPIEFAPSVCWVCRRTIMALPKQEYEEEKQHIVSQTLGRFCDLAEEELELASCMLDTYRKSKPDKPFWQSCRKQLRQLLLDTATSAPARNWILPLVDNDEELRPDALLGVLNSIAGNVPHALYRERVLQVSRMIRKITLHPSEVATASAWARECIRRFESRDDDEDLRVCDAAAHLLRRIVDRFLPENERSEFLRSCVFLSDHKSKETRDVLAQILSVYGTLESAELLERVRVQAHRELGDSCHRFPDNCARIAKEIRGRLEGEDL